MSDTGEGAMNASRIAIIPAIMPRSIADLTDKLLQVKGLVPLVQIDIMDGVFVPEKTWPYTPGGPQEFTKFSSEQEGLPFWESVNFEIDLMVANPESVADDWMRAGATRIIMHVESVKDFATTLAALSHSGAKGELGGLGVEVGIALNTTTSLEAIEPFIEKVNFVQCMGIQRIGYQGQSFDERVLTHLQDLRVRYKDLILSVDGGVSVETAPRLVAAGANRLVAGSAIFGQGDTRAALKQLQTVAQV